MILMIDNYDSFTYNLVHYLKELGREVLVRRNDALSIGAIERLNPEAIVISPGPCSPSEAGISIKVIQYFQGKIPILGICLGHQSIAMAYGGLVIKAPEPVHGKLEAIDHDGRGLFKGLKMPLHVTRYHSLVVEEKSMPSVLEVSARSGDGLIMGIRHKTLLVEGVQFHPEAVLTEQGHDLLNNFLVQSEVFWLCK